MASSFPKYWNTRFPTQVWIPTSIPSQLLQVRPPKRSEADINKAASILSGTFATCGFQIELDMKREQLITHVRILFTILNILINAYISKVGRMDRPTIFTSSAC